MEDEAVVVRMVSLLCVSGNQTITSISVAHLVGIFDEVRANFGTFSSMERVQPNRAVCLTNPKPSCLC